MSKLSLVTGGVGGIGTAICNALKSAGYQVVAVDIVKQEAVDRFTEKTGIKVYRWDVSDPEQCMTGVEKITRDMGRHVDILINNAGITNDSMLHKMAVQGWDDVIKTNLSSMFFMSRAVIPNMRESRWGRIINISSINGKAGQIGQTNYSAAKAGVVGFTRALALESASKGVTVNAVAPGYTLTSMVKAMPEEILTKIIDRIPVGRLCTPEEVAAAVLFLVSDHSGFITGETLSINGGQYMD